MERKLRGVYHRVNRSVGMRLAEHAFVFVVQLRGAAVGEHDARQRIPQHCGDDTPLT